MTDPNETGFRIGDAIEVYWTEEQKWFSGTIDDNTSTHRYTNAGRKLTAPKLEINYDEGEKRTHSLHNTTVRHANSVPSLFMLLNDRDTSDRLTFDSQISGFVRLPDSEDCCFLLTDIDNLILTWRQGML